MKFKIIPAQINEFEVFGKDKKEIWIWVTWGRYDWTKFHTNDFEIFKNCKTVAEIQKLLDKKIQTIQPINKDKKDGYHVDFDNKSWNDAFNTQTLSKALGSIGSLEDDAFMNESSGGGSSAQVYLWKNVSKEEKKQTKTYEQEEYTLEDAAESFRDEVLTEAFEYSALETITLYRAPLKVVETMDDNDEDDGS